MANRAFIALFRGINVGGRTVPMAELRALFGELGYEDAKTYVQSGNVVFRADIPAPKLAAKIEEAFAARFGFASRVLVRDEAEWAALIAANPFPEAAREPARLHLFVLESEPGAGEAGALSEKAAALSGIHAEDSYVIRDKALYLHAPNGIGRSKLGEIIGRTLKVGMTARNWRTVLALGDMAEAAG